MAVFVLSASLVCLLKPREDQIQVCASMAINLITNFLDGLSLDLPTASS